MPFEFTAEQSALAWAVTTAARFAARGSSVPVLAGVRVCVGEHAATAEGTNLESRAVAQFAARGTGDVVMPARLFADIVKSLPGGKVTVAGDDDVTVTAGRSRFTVRPMPTDDWPRWGQGLDTLVTVDAKVLLDALHRVGVAASDDEARPVLTGVLFEAVPDALKLVATDSYRLALAALPGGSLNLTKPILVPGRALDELERVKPEGPVVVGVGERAVSFSCNDGTDKQVTIWTRLLEGEFPTYARLLPEVTVGKIVVGRESLASAVKRVMAVRGEDVPVRLHAVKGEGLRVAHAIADVGSGEDWIDADVLTAPGGPDTFDIAFNSKYLLDGLGSIDAETAVIGLDSSLKPATLVGQGDTASTYLLMPVRVP